MAISAPGVGSGLDVNSIVSQLVAIEKQPLTQLQSKATTFQSQLSLYGKVKSQASALGDAAALLAGPTGWNTQKASSSNTSAIGVIAGSAAVSTSLIVEVQQLARAQSTASEGVVAGSAVGVAGTLTLQLGAWAGTAFTAGSSPAVPVTITATDTVTSIASKINSANAMTSPAAKAAAPGMAWPCVQAGSDGPKRGNDLIDHFLDQHGIVRGIGSGQIGGNLEQIEGAARITIRRACNAFQLTIFGNQASGCQLRIICQRTPQRRFGFGQQVEQRHRARGGVGEFQNHALLAPVDTEGGDLHRQRQVIGQPLDRRETNVWRGVQKEPDQPWADRAPRDPSRRAMRGEYSLYPVGLIFQVRTK